MNIQEIQSTLFDYFENEAGIETTIGLEDSLVEGGVIDSFDIVALSVWIGQEFGFKISPLEVNLDNFDTVTRISQFIISRMPE